MEHTVANKSAAIANEHAHLAEPFRKLHPSGNHLFTGGFTPHQLHQAHYVRGTKEMRADDEVGAGGCRRNLIDVERRCIAGKDSTGLAHEIEFSENLPLERYSFEDRLNDHVHGGETFVPKSRLNQFQAFVHILLSEAAPFHRIRVILPNYG